LLSFDEHDCSPSFHEETTEMVDIITSGDRRHRRRLTFRVALLIPIAAALLFLRAREPNPPVLVGREADFPPGSMTYLVLSTTFYDPMPRFNSRLLSISIGESSPGEILAYLQSLLTQQPAMPIGRVSPVRIFLVRDPNSGFLALYPRDTHSTCPIAWVESLYRFVDPCHGATYSRLGAYISGPAPRDLDRFAVIVSDDGEVMVNVRDYQMGVPHQ
jgi:nitrite reductase/ring-hydroxylating ferredoxin subunit